MIELLAAIRGDRRLTHYQVSLLWAVVGRLEGDAVRVSHAELADDMRVGRRTVVRALSELPPDAPIRVIGGKGANPTFVVNAPLLELLSRQDATVAPEPEATEAPHATLAQESYAPQAQLANNDAPSYAPQAQVQTHDAPSYAPQAQVGARPARRLRPDRRNNALSYAPQAQETKVHTQDLPRVGGGRGGSDLICQDLFKVSEEVHTQTRAGARESQEPEPEGTRTLCGSSETELRLRAQAYKRDPLSTGLTLGPPESWGEVRQVAESYREVWGREARVSGGHIHVQKILDRFAEGYSAEDLCQAIVGSHRDTNTLSLPQYQGLHTILKHGGQVERFAALAEGPVKVSPSGRPIQPNYGLVGLTEGYEVIR